MNALPRCPRCNSKKVSQLSAGLYSCAACDALFDDDPDEGGTYSDRNPAARIEREERQRRKAVRR